MEKINYSYFFNTNSNLSSVEKLLMLDEFYQEFCLECDLYDICQGQVICDRIEHFMGSFIEDKFDNIFIGKYINNYNNYNSIIKSSIEKLKVNGVIVFMLKNMVFQFRFRHHNNILKTEKIFSEKN